MAKSDSPNPATEILRAYWKSDRRMLLVVAAVVILASVSAVAGPYVFSRFIDRLSRTHALATVVWSLALYPVLLGLASSLQRVAQYLAYMSAENLGFITSTRFFERILKKTTVFFIEHNPVEIQSANAQGRSALTMLVQLCLGSLIPGVIQIALTLITLGTLINFQIVAIVVVYGVVAVTITTLSVQRSRAFLDSAVQAGQRSARFVGGAINAMETLRHFGSHRWMSRRFSETAQEVRDNWRAYVLRRTGYVGWLGIALMLQFGVTFYLLLPRYSEGTITIGSIVLFNTLLLQLNQPFEMIAHTIDEMTRVRASLAPFVAMWRAPEESQVSHDCDILLSEGRVVFDNVSYRYENGRGVFGVNLIAERGRITFLVGETGSGKSTVFKLALKSIEASVGRILVDDIDLKIIPSALWYERVAVVPQDAVLLNESLADNILLGRPRDENRLLEATAKAAILPFINNLPDGFETTVGERGLKLSGGERQRIAIARALYGKPAILFLDEASSALDEQTERDVMDHVRGLAEEVTVIAITHRLSVVAETDQLVRVGKPETSSMHAHAGTENLVTGSSE
jgi:ATP-binding cassette, subfamily B, bacterial